MAIIEFTAPGARLPESSRTPAAATREIDITRLYRAFVQPNCWREPERTVFVEAGSREGAVRKIATIIAALEYGKPEAVRERLYNLASAVDLIAENISEDHRLRLFECGWSGDQVISWISQPLFLLREPAALIRAWTQLPQP
jgi:hypothetical protein